MAPPLVKILLLVFIRWNKNRSYTEKVKYPLFLLYFSMNCRDSSVKSKLIISLFQTVTFVVVVVLLFYVHGKHLRSYRDGQLTLPHFSWAGLDLLSGKPVFRAHTFASNWQLPFLKKRKEKRKYVARPGIEPRTPWLTSQVPYRLRYAARQQWNYHFRFHCFKK